MKIALLGATGRVGNEILSLLLNAGHSATILVRTPEKIQISSPSLTVLKGDATKYNDIEQVIVGSDLVISALNTDGTNTLSVATPYIISAMNKFGLNRLITIGTAGILQSRLEPEEYRFQSSESRRKTTRAAEQHLTVYHQLQGSKLNWTIVCPTYLPDGELTKNYRYEADFLPEDGKEISVQDTAHFAFQQIKSEEFMKKRVGICY
ncbi:NAD(P)-dependent oxidoreductase [Metabacillus litoralis]|uniref:NAD(P)-dependent oxidoreductase n=1 Tax=Metabacillus litoralis TaxID=152268 RepID=UPI001CFF2D04|nr:NAD(P)H-binding protein [Metabacillus litoralis]